MLPLRLYVGPHMNKLVVAVDKVDVDKIKMPND